MTVTTIVDPHRAEARADMLDRIEHGTAADWFNRLDPAAYERTGGRTLSEAWHAGDREAVVALLDDWLAASQATAEHHRANPAYMTMIEALRADIAEKAKLSA